MPLVCPDGLAQDAIEVGLLIGVAEKVEGADIHGGEVIAVFIATSWSRDSDHGDFCSQAADVSSKIFEGSIIEPVSAKARRNVVRLEDLRCFGNAGDPLGIYGE